MDPHDPWLQKTSALSPRPSSWRSLVMKHSRLSLHEEIYATAKKPAELMRSNGEGAIEHESLQLRARRLGRAFCTSRRRHRSDQSTRRPTTNGNAGY